MNFLAHFTLAYPEPALLVGNFLGDFIKNKDLPHFSETVQQGVHLHRQIDSYTDTHPATRELTARWHQYHHKYAPVVADLLFDYALASDWETFGPLPMPEFCATVYEALEKARPTFSPRLANRTERMIADNWLIHYTTPRGIVSVANRLQRRVSRPDLFGEVGPTLERDAAIIQEIFRVLFPEVLAFVREWKENR